MQRFDRGFIPKSQQTVDARVSQELPAYELAAAKLLDALAERVKGSMIEPGPPQKALVEGEGHETA